MGARFENGDHISGILSYFVSSQAIPPAVGSARRRGGSGMVLQYLWCRQ